jgi:hypothetical protein
MSEGDVIHTAVTPSVPLTPFEVFGLPKDGVIPVALFEPLSELVSSIKSEMVDDPGFFNNVIKSIESKYPRIDDPVLRIGKILDVVKLLKTSGKPLKDVLDSLGMLNINELEEYAKETGNWGPFLKKVSKK